MGIALGVSMFLIAVLVVRLRCLSCDATSYKEGCDRWRELAVERGDLLSRATAERDIYKARLEQIQKLAKQ